VNDRQKKETLENIHAYGTMHLVAERERMKLEPKRQVHISPCVTMLEAFLLSATTAILIDKIL
jgi:hypothetical protein